MTIRYDQNGITIREADALQVAASYPDSHFTLAILDGPYAMNKAAWDRLKISDLPRWYRPHIEAAGRILAPSASLYLWNTAEGWATLHPLMVSMGWTFRGLITWDKEHSPAQLGAAAMTGAIDTTEVCGVYTRLQGAARADVLGFSVWRMSEQAYRKDRLKQSVATPDRNPLRGLTFSALHPCQKPLIFANRMIRASTRPGERVWVPFGGTCREAVAADKIRRSDPTEAREVVTCELNQDGPDYLDPVIRILNGEGSAPIDKRQPQLF